MGFVHGFQGPGNGLWDSRFWVSFERERRSVQRRAQGSDD